MIKEKKMIIVEMDEVSLNVPEDKEIAEVILMGELTMTLLTIIDFLEKDTKELMKSLTDLVIYAETTYDIKDTTKTAIRI